MTQTKKHIFTISTKEMNHILYLIRSHNTNELLSHLNQLPVDDAFLHSHIIAKNGEKMTLADCVAVHQNVAVLKHLHKRGVNIKRSLISIFGGVDYETLNYLIDHNVFLANAKDSRGLTPLQNLCIQCKWHPEQRARQLEIAETMIHCGSNPNQKGFNNVTPHEIASHLNEPELIAIFQRANHQTIH